MENSKKAKNILKEAVCKAAMKSAEKSVDSACMWFQYQPKQPKALKKLKK